MKNFFNLLPLILLVLSCVKNQTLAEDDLKYLITYDQLQFQEPGYVVKPLKSGDEYYFSKKINHFGLYSLYATTVINKANNNEIKITCTANKLHKEHNIEKLFDSKSTLLKFYENSIKKIDLEKFNSDKGFYINSEDYLYLVLKRETILFSITMEGKHQTNISDLEKLIIEKMENLYTTN